MLMIEWNGSLHSPSTVARNEIVRCVVSVDTRSVHRKISRTGGRHRRVVLIVRSGECSGIVQPIDNIHRGCKLLMALMMAIKMPVRIIWLVSR